MTKLIFFNVHLGPFIVLDDRGVGFTMGFNDVRKNVENFSIDCFLQLVERTFPRSKWKTILVSYKSIKFYICFYYILIVISEFSQIFKKTILIDI